MGDITGVLTAEGVAENKAFMKNEEFVDRAGGNEPNLSSVKL